jgi:hypothetical protein
MDKAGHEGISDWGGMCQLIWRRLLGRSDLPLTTVHDTLQIVWFSLRQNRVSVGTRVRSGPKGGRVAPYGRLP